MKLGVEVTFKSNIPQVLRKVESISKDRMLESVNEVRNTVLETLSGTRKPDPTRIYYVPGTRKKYQASSPGQPPAVATGELRQSIKTSVEGEGKKVIGTVGTKVKHGLMLEFGTRKMAARPWLRKSLEKTLPKLNGIWGKRWF